MAPIQAATIIIGYGLLYKSYGTWKLRSGLDWRRIAPFVIGGAAGAPIGSAKLTQLDPNNLRPAPTCCSCFMAVTIWRDP